jgi:hypothetical protein
MTRLKISQDVLLPKPLLDKLPVTSNKETKSYLMMLQSFVPPSTENIKTPPPEEEPN